MPCSTFIPFRQDRVIIMCAKERVPVCSVKGCRREAVVLCDGPAPAGLRRRTCDKNLCLKHAYEVAPDHHLCLEHAAGILGVEKAARAIKSKLLVTDLTSCRDVKCHHRKRCLRWTDCLDDAVQVFDFGATKAHPQFQCRWFQAVFTKKKEEEE